MQVGVRCALFVGALLLGLQPAAASQARQVNLEQMAERAGRIFAGRCIESTLALEPVRGEVWRTTFAVERTVKGRHETRLTIETIGGDSAGVPRFRPGDDVILFLYAESDLGLTSPVGLGQGRFKVVADKHGQRVAVNDFSNANLLTGLSPRGRERIGTDAERLASGKQIEAGALLDLVKRLVDAPR